MPFQNKQKQEERKEREFTRCPLHTVSSPQVGRRGMSAPQFFVDHKRGEVNEIRGLLRNPKILKDTQKIREVIKKVRAVRGCLGGGEALAPACSRAEL